MIAAVRLLRRPFARRRPTAAPVTRPRGARPVRALAWGAGALALATAGFAGLLEVALPQVRDPEYGYRLAGAEAARRDRPHRPLVLALGTSRTQNAVDPAAMGFPDEPGAPRVYNLGQPSIRPLHLRLLRWRLDRDGVRPAALLVEVFPLFLGVGGPADAAFPAPGRLTAGDMEWLAPHVADPAGLRRRWAVGRLNAWTAHGPALVGWAAPRWLPDEARVDYHRAGPGRGGFVPFPPEQATGADRARWLARTREQYAAVFADLRVSAETEAAYRGLVADCRAAGVPVAFFRAPESPTLRGWYAPASRAAVDGFVRRLRDELGCPVFDAPAGYTDDDFVDGHHLLQPAAARFSRDLADRHLKGWVANGR